MALFKQESDTYKIFLGWYGRCGETPSDERYSLREHSEIRAVYKASKFGLDAYSSSAPDFMQGMLYLEVGNAYWVVIEPGQGEFVIPGFTLSFSQNSEDGKIPNMISDCGISEPTPTPEPQPTPTPSVNHLQFRWAIIGDREILQVANILTPTSSQFVDRDTTNTWSTLYAFKFSEQAYDLSHDVWPDAAVSDKYVDYHPAAINFGDLEFSLHQRTLSDGRNYYQLALNNHASHTEYLPNVDITTQPYNLFIFSGDNTDPNNMALTTDESWPVIAKKIPTRPTPTPTPSIIKNEPQRILKIPVLMVGWDTGNSDPADTMHFRGQKLEFGNDGGTRYATIDDIENMLNGENYNYPFASEFESPSGSLREFVESWTLGNLRLQFDILPCGNVQNPNSDNPNDYAYITDKSYSRSSQGGNTTNFYYGKQYLIRDCFLPAFRNALNYYGETNYNKDYIGTFPCYIQAGFSYSDSPGSTKHPWSHKSAFIYNGRKVKYQLNPFRMPVVSGSTNSARIKEIGVYAHETGHVFGPGDLYGRYAGSQGTQPNGLGTINLMASGSKGGVWGKYHLPSYPNGWTKYAMMKGLEIDMPTQTITEDTNDVEVYPVASEFKATRIFDPNNTQDVWWIDYREDTIPGYNGKINYDKIIGDRGLLISRQTFGRELDIDEQSIASNSNRSPIPKHRRAESGHFLTISQKDGKYELLRGTSGSRTNNDLYHVGEELGPHTIPATTAYDGVPSGIKISNIRKTERGSMMFDVKFLNEPSHKIVNINYQSNQGHIHFNEGHDNQQYTEIGRTAEADVKIKITTENVQDGATVSIHYPVSDVTVVSSPVSNNECVIEPTGWNRAMLFRPRSNASDTRIFSFKIQGEPYSDAFVFNDCVLINGRN